MTHILEQRISETNYNTKLEDNGLNYVVTYGHQVEKFDHDIAGLLAAIQEYKECVIHCVACELED